MSLAITRGFHARPQRGVLYAPEGIGKSTLASLLPNPLFIDLEQGTHHLDVARVEPQTLDQFHVVLDSLIAGSQGFSTLVIDTIDWLEEIAIKGICATHKKSGLEDFGYGKGYTFLAEEINLILTKLDRVAARMSVILLAHSEVKRTELPDLPPFDRYQLRLSKSVMPLVKEWADFVVFGNYETVLKAVENEERGKAVRARNRQLWCNHAATADAKNRVGMKDIEPWTAETLLSLVGGTQVAPAAPVAQAPTPAAAPAPRTRRAAAPKPQAAAPVEPAAVVAKVNEILTAPVEEDHVPGLELPPEKEELRRVLDEHAALATTWLVKHHRIQEGQTYLDMDESTRRRVLGNPAGFIAHIKL